jgi:hypothetical protein
MHGTTCYFLEDSRASAAIIAGPIDTPIMLDAKVLCQTRGCACGSLGTVDHDAPSASSAPLPGVGHAIPLALSGALCTHGLVPA